ncbi:MAG: T9SS type A sorting domain-containing protein [Calditrichaeota bacterium]|nr:T9SS type A sorting domain-containing protein [Calditrichota bacterium]
MKTITITFLLLFLLPHTAHSYDPPEVFAVFTAENQVIPFADDFCWIEDQNGDGCDELLINNNPFIPGLNNYGAINQVMFYWGGEDMDDNVDIVFGTNNDNLGFGSHIIFQGNIIPDHNPFVTIQTRIGNSGSHGSLYMYEAGEEIDNEVDLILTTTDYDGYSGIYPGRGRLNRPADLNGDGYHDIIVKEVGDDGHYRPLTVFFGGEDFDTIPDWRPNNFPWSGIYDVVSGFDINGDGYDDIFVRGNAYYVFLGGDPMDTTVAFYLEYTDFECEDGPTALSDGLTMLQDVNDDGYDDWGVPYWYSDPWDEYDGYFIFFGGEEPDLEPDLVLETGHSSITGGDFNGDGIGDIVTGYVGCYWGEIRIYFGSRWMDGGESDIMIRHRDNGSDAFPNIGCKLGASGDYNGDGVDDIVAKSYSTRRDNYINQLVILLGNEDWVVDVDEPDLPEEYMLSLDATPNPFNNQITITYQVPVSGNVLLDVYDVQGRLVEHLENIDKSNGAYNTTWNCSNSGIYLLLMQAGDRQVVKKVVCIK